MNATANATLDLRDPDSPEGEAQEPTDDAGAEPSPTEDGAGPDGTEAAADADTAGEPDAADTGAEGEPSAEVVAAEPSRPIADSPPPAPFSPRVYGQRLELEGATEQAGNVVIPRATWDKMVQPRLVDPVREQRREKALRTQLEEAKANQSEEVERAKLILGHVDQLLSNKEAFIRFAQNFDSEAPKLQLKVANEILTKRLERTTKRQETDGERGIGDRLTQQARPAIDTVIKDVLEGVEGVDSKEAADFIHDLWENGTPIFFKVQPGDNSGLDPEEDPIGVDVPRIARLLAPMIDRAKRAAADKKAAAVKASNAKALGKTDQPKPPATVPTKGSPVPGGEKKTFKNSAEYNEYMANKYGQPNSRSG